MNKELIARFTAAIRQGEARDWEELFVQWSAENVAKGYLRDYPKEAATQGATLAQLIQVALDDPTFIANARAQFRFETLNDVKPRG